MMKTKIPFPSEAFGEWTVFRPFTAPGLFAYRHVQADSLLRFPDFGGGDLNTEQRREALDRALVFYRPLRALVIFLNVVALEDFIRDLGTRLTDIDDLAVYFPKIARLRPTLKEADPDRPSARRDKDAARLLKFDEVNALYLDCVGVEPIPKRELPRLCDLALLRHTVAHNGAVSRVVDVDRFQYYQVHPNRVLDPPVEFVKETCQYLYRTGREFENSVRDGIFSVVVPRLGKSWSRTPPKILLDLIEEFNWFGKLVESSGGHLMMVDYETYLREESERVRAELTKLCIAELKTAYDTKSTGESA